MLENENKNEKYIKDENGNYVQEKKLNPIKKLWKYGRNKPCPCGSKKKFKSCCMRKVYSGEIDVH